MIKWKLESVALKLLVEHEKNPRQITKDQFNRLGQLIDKFGLIDKPIINADMTIIGGHQRIKFLRKKKEKFVECWVAEEQLSKEDIDELCIGLNLHQGSWDWDILANQWEPLDLLKYGFSEEKLLESCKQAEEILEDTQKKESKKKSCPSCGHEF